MSEFAPGFRITPRDKIVLAVGVAVTVGLAPFMPIAAVIAATAVGHFFLFCNVFRIPRMQELFWAVAFVVTMLFHLQGYIDLLVAFAIHETVAVRVIHWAAKLPSYHGIYWERWNPGLREWWEARQ